MKTEQDSRADFEAVMNFNEGFVALSAAQPTGGFAGRIAHAPVLTPPSVAKPSRLRKSRNGGRTRSAPLVAIPAGTTLVTLGNGLTIIVREDASAPVVSAQAWCMAGSIHEGRWLGAGLSHVLEHMLFKGTATRSGQQIDEEVQAAGGHMNAYTSFDRTVYYIDVPNTGARVAVDILCDIMQHATLPADELAKEQEVIRREMDMGQDDPHQRAGRRLFETAYTRSPYRYTVIGYPDIFNELKRDDIVSYYHEKYAPNNVFFVVAGDVRASEVIAQIREAYARTKARALPPVVLPAEPRQTAAREIVEEARGIGCTCILPGTFPSCAIPTSRPWTSWPWCWAAGAVRVCFNASAKPGDWCIPWTPGLTVPAIPGCWG